jgi:hypothetical protein
VFELNPVPLDDELLLELELLELEDELELLDEELELLLEEELEVPPQPMGEPETTMSSIQTSAALLLKLCQPNMA